MLCVHVRHFAGFFYENLTRNKMFLPWAILSLNWKQYKILLTCQAVFPCDFFGGGAVLIVCSPFNHIPESEGILCHF